MDNIVTADLSIITISIAVFVSTNLFFFKMDDYFSVEFKDDIAIRLLCLDVKNKHLSWIDIFIKLFDKIFKSKSKSKNPLLAFANYRTFLKSSLASIFSLLILILIGVTIGPFGTDVGLVLIQKNWLQLLSLGMILNFFPDYVSLLETRFLLEVVSKQKNILYILGYLILDIIFTIFIFIVLFIFSITFIDQSKDFNDAIALLLSFLKNYQSVLWVSQPEVDSVVKYSIFGLFLYTTLLTSVWLWLFIISTFIIKNIGRGNRLVNILKYVLPIEKRPFRSIGLVASTFAMLGYLLFAIF